MVIKSANEARSQAATVRKTQTDNVAAEMNKTIQRAVDKGECEVYVTFPLSIKVECLKMISDAGYATVSSGNVTHAGKYQIKISWK